MTLLSQSSAAFVDPHGHYVSPTEQSTVPGDPETNAYDQVPPFHSLSNQSDCEGIPTQEAPGTLFLNDIIHTTPPDSYLTKYVRLRPHLRKEFSNMLVGLRDPSKPSLRHAGRRFRLLRDKRWLFCLPACYAAFANTTHRPSNP